MNDEDLTAGPWDGQPAPEPGPIELYEIRVSGRLSPRWAAWFDGLTVTSEDDGTTVIRGPVVDQAALHGLLQKLRDLGITLLSLTRTTASEPVEHPASPTPTITNTHAPGATS